MLLLSLLSARSNCWSDAEPNRSAKSPPPGKMKDLLLNASQLNSLLLDPPHFCSGVAGGRTEIHCSAQCRAAASTMATPTVAPDRNRRDTAEQTRELRRGTISATQVSLASSRGLLYQFSVSRLAHCHI